MIIDTFPCHLLIGATILVLFLLAILIVLGIAAQIGAMIERIDNERGGSDIDIKVSHAGEPVIPQPKPSRAH